MQQAVHRPEQPEEARQEPHQGGAGPVQAHQGDVAGQGEEEGCRYRLVGSSDFLGRT